MTIYTSTTLENGGIIFIQWTYYNK
jgi:hypothetical protein